MHSLSHAPPAKRIYQFTAIQPPTVSPRLIRTSDGPSTTVVLDLEDSLWDVDDEARTAQLKEAGRVALTDLARSYANLFAGQPVGVRINRCGASRPGPTRSGNLAKWCG